MKHPRLKLFYVILAIAGGNMAAAGTPEAMAQPGQGLRTLSTDRPDKTESPFTVDKGHFQVEMDLVNFTADSAIENGHSISVETFGVAPVNLKYGIGLNSDVQLVFEPFVRQTVTDRSTGARTVAEGSGDITIRLKYNLFGNDGGREALALMPFISLPTGAGGIGSSFVQGGFIVPLAINLREGVDLGLMSGMGVSANAGGCYAPVFVQSATLGFDLTEALGLYTEVYTEQGLERGNALIVTLDAGVTYALSLDSRIDIGVNFGATRAADDLGLFIGLSRRF